MVLLQHFFPGSILLSEYFCNLNTSTGIELKFYHVAFSDFKPELYDYNI